MKLGLELLTSRPTPIRLGTFFETWIATRAGTIGRSIGRDEYHLALTVDAERRLAATGRTYICQLDLESAGLGINQARGTVLVPGEIDRPEPMVWGIRTNLFLDVRSLTVGATARLICADREPVGFRFDDPHLLAEEVAPGRYIVQINRLLQG